MSAKYLKMRIVLVFLLAFLLAFTMFMPLTQAFAAETETPAQEETQPPDAEETPAPEESQAPDAEETPAPEESQAPDAEGTPAPEESQAPDAEGTPAPEETQAPDEAPDEATESDEQGLTQSDLFAGVQSTNIENFVTRFYQQCLGRTPDSTGLNNWVNQLISGEKTGADVAEGFIRSDEFQAKGLSDEDYLDVMYAAFFNRAPDSSGLATWKSKLYDGYSRNIVLAGFVNSDEFKNLCNSYGIIPGEITLTGADLYPEVAPFVTRLYRKCLGRTPDATGLNNWVNYLISGQKTGAEVASNIVTSAEFKNKGLTDTNYINVLYQAFMNRTADSTGMNTWKSKLNSGYSRDYVMAGFINSNEFNSICQSYGITTGSVTFSDVVGKNPEVAAFVTRMYRLCMSREPDSGGLSDWVSKLVNHETTGADMAYGFVYSDEFLSKDMTNNEFVTIMYQAFLNRTPDSAGLSNWAYYLDAGYYYHYVLCGFVNSAEFQSICSSYGITASTLPYWLEDQTVAIQENYVYWREHTSSYNIYDTATSFVNTSGKTIKYLSITYEFYNSVGDPVDYFSNNYGLTRPVTIKYVGPIYPDEYSWCSYDYLGWNPLIYEIRIGEMTLEYTDGTSGTYYYGYSVKKPDFIEYSY
jgi:hypothetical protein